MSERVILSSLVCISGAYFRCLLNRTFSNRGFRYSFKHIIQFTVSHFFSHTHTPTHTHTLLQSANSREYVHVDIIHRFCICTNQIFQRQPLSINFIMWVVEQKSEQEGREGEKTKRNIFYFHCVLFIYYMVHCCCCCCCLASISATWNAVSVACVQFYLYIWDLHHANFVTVFVCICRWIYTQQPEIYNNCRIDLFTFHMLDVSYIWWN